MIEDDDSNASGNVPIARKRLRVGPTKQEQIPVFQSSPNLSMLGRQDQGTRKTVYLLI